MGCSNSHQMSESNKDKSLVKRNPMNKPESFYCFTDEEVEIIQSLLSEKKYEPDDYISYITYINIDDTNTTYKEYATIQTGKKDGQAHSGKFNFQSNIVKGNELTTNVKINNIPIETIKQKENKYESECLEVEIDYNLNENDSSIMTIELNTNSETKMIDTDNYIHFLCFDFRSPASSYFKLNAKCSSMFKYSNISRKPKNKLEEISPTEILLAGKEYEDNNTITFRQLFRDYDLNGDVENIYNCDTMELYSLNYALNSVGLNYGNTNIFGIKDIFDIVSISGECKAKSYIYLIYPTEPNTVLSTFFFLDLEQNSLKLIDSKVNNAQQKCDVSSDGEIIIPYNLTDQQFCTVELDYSFNLRKIDDRNSPYDYNLCVKHKNLLDKGFYSCEINLRFSEYQILSNGLYCDDFDKDRETTRLKYKGFKIENPLIMLNLKK